MKKIYSKTVLLFLTLACQVFSQTPSLTLLNSYSLTPNTTDTIGAFCRIYYHQPRNKFYTIYAARPAGSTAPSGQLNNFAWREYNSSMVFTGNKGILPGITGAGDFACVMVDSTYYHLTALGSTTSGILKYKLTKFDDNFTTLASTTITLSNHDSNIDQLLNYTNNRLIIGAMLDSSATPPVTPPLSSYNPNVHIYQYDLNLNPLAADKVTTPKAYSWGASCIFNGGNYYVLTTNSIATHSLYCYKYDASFNHISTTQISPDGQWSQGVIWDGTYYYLAHHFGDHNHGNVKISIYDVNWNAVYSTSVTNFPMLSGPGTSNNAHRPFLLKLGSKLYVSYDLETYINIVNQKDWQSAVKVYQINGVSGIDEENENNIGVSVFPNPTNDSFTVKILSSLNKETLIVTDALGNKVCEQSFIGSLTIETRNWQKGIYFYSIKGKNNVGKILVQ